MSYSQKGSTREALTKEMMTAFEITLPSPELMRSFGQPRVCSCNARTGTPKSKAPACARLAATSLDERRNRRMKAEDVQLTHLFAGPKQFIVPIFQRDYSWGTKHCLQLWNDIIRVGSDEKVKAHLSAQSCISRPKKRLRKLLAGCLSTASSVDHGHPLAGGAAE